MSGTKAFVDTNLIVYLYSEHESEKQQTVITTLNQYDRLISTQVLNEFCNVCIRKLNLPISNVKKAIEEICETNEVLILEESHVTTAQTL
jgi:predicted nucleic acid-binding protein